MPSTFRCWLIAARTQGLTHASSHRSTQPITPVRTHSHRPGLLPLLLPQPGFSVQSEHGMAFTRKVRYFSSPMAPSTYTTLPFFIPRSGLFFCPYGQADGPHALLESPFNVSVICIRARHRPPYLGRQLGGLLLYPGFLEALALG